MQLTDEQKCLLWLSAAEITPDRVETFRAHFGSIEAIWEAFGKANGPAFHAGTLEILQKLHSYNAIDTLCEQLERKNVKLLFEDDPDYPEPLRQILDPPYLLYYSGHLECFKHPMIGVVGTRKASSYGMEMASMIADGLSRAGVCVVSGLARGIDEAAHCAVVEAGGRTVGVMGSGLNVPYPPEHTGLLRKIAGGIGLVISEYPLDASPKPFHFPHRNRIISGLTQGIVFVEGRIKSGGMHTVQAALTQGRNVFAVPGRVGAYGSEGPHAILREGARIVTSAEDILDDLGLPLQGLFDETNEIVHLAGLQLDIVNRLRIEPSSSRALAQALSANEAEIITELGMLEIMGIVQREAGNRFHLPLSASK